MRIRDMSWESYGITRNRYKELKYFCMQYDEKKSKINRDLSAVKYDGNGGGSNSVSSPTEQQAMKNVEYERDCKMIEDAAKKASNLIWKYILLSVTKDLSYEFVAYNDKLGQIPVGKTEFYAYRRKFYYILGQMRDNHPAKRKSRKK